MTDDSAISGQVRLLESMLNDTGEFVGFILDLALRLRALETSDPPSAGTFSGFGALELELRISLVKRDLTDQKPPAVLGIV